jgi:prepilin-type N-terminal cleavage/methylation domain-containing protein
MITSERGFTLVEVLVAALIIGVGLVAVAAGFQVATGGVEIGRQQTMATFLAEQRLEQVRAQALTNFTAAGVASGLTQEPYGSLPNAPNYRRDTTIADFDPDADGVVDLKQVRVTVWYWPVATTGGVSAERQLTANMLVTRRQ